MTLPDSAPICPRTGFPGFSMRGAIRTRDRINALIGSPYYVKRRCRACGLFHVRLLPRSRRPVPPPPPLSE